MIQTKGRASQSVSLPSRSRRLKPRVAIIGRGRVGTALSQGLERSGYDVRKVGKDPVVVPETARWGEVVVLAVPYISVDDVLSEMGDSIEGRILVDLTNPIKNGEFALGHESSGAEELQMKAPGAKVVKAFNTVFASHMDSGTAKGRQLSLFVAADDKDAKEVVMEIGKDVGFDAIDAGPLTSARWLEPLGYLNILLGLKLGMGTGIGFSLVH